MTDIVARLRSEAPQTDPFPHLYVENLIPPQLCDEISRHWPPAAAMQDEGDNLDRGFALLVHDDQWQTHSLPPDIRPFWERLMRTTLANVYSGIADAFAPWISARLGHASTQIGIQIHRLMALEAGTKFVEHTPHAHIGAPNWVFTFLLYIEDGGRRDRGTSLYGVDADFSSKGDVFAGVQKNLRRVRDAEFRRGAILAFFDSALSVHGSTPFNDPGAPSTRRIIRSHVSLGPSEVERTFGAPTETLNAGMVQACQRFHADKDASGFSCFKLDTELRLLQQIAAQHRPAAPADVSFAFPAFE